MLVLKQSRSSSVPLHLLKSLFLPLFNILKSPVFSISLHSPCLKHLRELSELVSRSLEMSYGLVNRSCSLTSFPTIISPAGCSWAAGMVLPNSFCRSALSSSLGSVEDVEHAVRLLQLLGLLTSFSRLGLPPNGRIQ